MKELRVWKEALGSVVMVSWDKQSHSFMQHRFIPPQLHQALERLVSQEPKGEGNTVDPGDMCKDPTAD